VTDTPTEVGHGDQPTGHLAPAFFEREDASPASIVKFAIALLAFTLVTAGGVLVFLPLDASRQSGHDPAAVPLALGPREPLDKTRWNAPQTPDGGIALQTHPVDELVTFRAAEARALHEAGWVDRQAGIVHIPIERAMELYVERGGNGGPLGAAATAAAPAQPMPSPTPTPSPSPELGGQDR
jgi:hypothetical protein